jgi:hypothetical protein
MTIPALVGCVVLATTVASAGDLQKAAQTLCGKYVADIEKLAQWCESNGLTAQARATRHVLCPSDPYKLYVPILSEAVEASKLPPDTPPNVLEWDSRLSRLRRDQAAALFDIARRAIRSGSAALAFDLAMAAVQADPDYEPARRLFGYQKFHDKWRTVYEVRKLRAGLVWSNKFGWQSKNNLRRYDDGQRFYEGRWISAKEDAERHRDIRSGWDVDTEHYTIRTNHSIEAAVALGVKLEQLNRLWRQMFIRYYASEADVVAMFDGRAKPSTPASRHSVVYFRDQADYNRALAAIMPNIGMSIGVYNDRMQRAYFFASGENDDRTLYHEATHQLFHESRPVVADVGYRANFWIIEGIAMYMESLRRENGFYVLGGFEDERLHAAAYRLLHDHFYIPLVTLTGFGMEQLQKDRRIATIYSQAAGQANFLVYYNGGRYRDALVTYLTAVYSGHDNADTLAKLTGTGYDDLDRQYREFIENGEKKSQ